jgi:hypothetical protein
VTFETRSIDVIAVEAVDALGVIDAWPHFDDRRRAACKLAPGAYTARFVDAGRNVRGEIAFTVGVEPLILQGP